jgi:hypothetical protein
MTEDLAAVIHYRDGRTVRGPLETELDPDTDTFHATVDGESMEIAVNELKAVFFLRDPSGTDTGHTTGSILAVEFFDGEVIRGRSSGFNPGRSGFFLYPADRSKIDKIFVVSSAVVSTDVETM